MRLPDTPGAAAGGAGNHNGYSAFGIAGNSGLPGNHGGDGGFGGLGEGGFGGSGGSGDHDDLRMAVGALALDALDAEEARLVRAHLATCPECEAEYQSFVGVRGVMDAALVGGIPRAERHQAHVVERRPANSGVAAAPRRRRRVSRALAGVAAALVIAGAGIAGAALGSHRPNPPGQQLASATNSFGVTASIRYQQVNWGTWVQITMSNVPPDYSCSLVAYDKQGHEYAVSSWRSAEGQRTVTAPGGVALSPSEIDHFEVEMGPQVASTPTGWSLAIPMTS